MKTKDGSQTRRFAT